MIEADAKTRNTTLGEHCRLKSGSVIVDSDIGDYSYVCEGTQIVQTDVGKFTSIAAGCFIGMWEHDKEVTTHTLHLYESSGGFVKGYRSFKKDKVRTVIGCDVWIGVNSVVLKGVNVGDGCIIGASTVVTRDLEPYSVVCGNPCREIRKRFGKHEIAFLLRSRWWDLPRADIQRLVDNGAFESYNKMYECLKIDERV